MERAGDIITFNDRDRFRYSGLERKTWLPAKALPELFQGVVNEKERVGQELRKVMSGAGPRLTPGQELYLKADLTGDFSRLDLFLRELGEVAADVIIEYDVPVAM